MPARHFQTREEKTVETLGEHLKKHREDQGITLEEIEAVTKISITYLRYIDEERFDKLPAPIFTLGFLKQYAQCIGLDPEDVVLRYRLAARSDGASSQEDNDGQSWSVRRRAFWILLAAVCGTVFLWLFLAPGEDRKEERVRSIRFPRTTDREMKKQQLRDELQLGSESASDRSPGQDAGVPGALPDRAAPGTRHMMPETGPVTVTLQAVRETRVKATLDGDPAAWKELDVGEQVSWQAREKIQLEIGSGNGVRIFYRGKVYEKLGRKGEVVHIVFPPPAP
jgi:cytoskeleton protein RodZ